MRMLAVGIGFVVLITVQATWLDWASIAGVKPDLALVAVFFLGLMRGKIQGTVGGLILGYLMDLTSGGGWSVQTGVKAFVGYLSGLLGETLVNLTFIFSGIAIACLSMMQGVVLLLVSDVGLDAAVLSYHLLYRILPEAIYEGVIGCLIFPLLSYYGLIQRKHSQRSLADELFFLSSRRTR